MKQQKKSNFLFIITKKNIIPIIFLLFTIFLVLFSKTNLVAAKNGLTLWANSVLPSLLPFFIATELLSNTSIIPIIGKLLNKFMRPIFNVPGEGAYAFLIGMISGYPVGAKVVTKLRQDGVCSKSEGERMLSFSNNSGPLFIIGTVGISLFGNSQTGFLLLFTHILACITVGVILGLLDRFKKNNDTYHIHTSFTSSKIDKPCNFSSLGEILGNSINNAISSVVMIGGFVVLFSVIISILKQSHIIDAVCALINPFLKTLDLNTSISEAFITGIVELTNGVKLASSIHDKIISNQIILCAFLLGFGGFSVLLQVLSITSKSDLSIKPYFIGKILQGLFAAIYTYIALRYISFLNLDLQPVFSYNDDLANNITPHISPIFYLILCILLCLLIYISKIRKQKKTYSHL